MGGLGVAPDVINAGEHDDAHPTLPCAGSLDCGWYLERIPLVPPVPHHTRTKIQVEDTLTLDSKCTDV